MPEVLDGLSSTETGQEATGIGVTDVRAQLSVVREDLRRRLGADVQRPERTRRTELDEPNTVRSGWERAVGDEQGH